MDCINASSRLRPAVALFVAVLCLVGPAVARTPKAVASLDHYYDGSGFDLNDELSRMPHLRAAHRQEVPADGAVQTPVVAVVKNEDLLPTNLFVTPDIMLNETHPRSESPGYLQVLQAMKYTPVAAGAGTRDIQAKAGLNSALLKILSTTKQFTSSANSAVASSSVTINQILQNWASLAFGNTYNEFNASAAVASAPKVQEVVVAVPPKTVVTYANGTTVELEGDYNVNQNGAIIPTQETAGVQTAAEAQAEAQVLAQVASEAPEAVAQEANEVVQAPVTVQTVPVEPEEAAQAEIPSRLLSLFRMYSEHLMYKNQEVIADESHYGHLKGFASHLGCITDEHCDFPKHLLGAESRSRHALETYIANKKDVTSAHAAEFQGEVLSFVKSLPNYASNDQIKQATGEWIAKNQKYLDDFQGNWPATNGKIQDGLASLKANLPFYQNMDSQQFLAVLDSLSKNYKAKIDEEFTANGLSNKANELIEMRQGIEALHNGLRGVIPAQGVLDNDFSELEQKLARHIAVFQSAAQLSDDQLVAARNRLKNNLQMQINGVDPEANSALVRSIANDADAILKSDFGKSLNQENLNFIVQKSINALKVDFDQMKDSRKASGFMLDQSDLQRLADDVVDELKKGREANQKVILDLRDFNKYVQAQNRLYSASPNSGDAAQDAADLLISYENFYYDALSSDAFYADLQNYIAKYYDVWYAHVTPLQPFFNYSSAFKTLTAGLDNPNALGGANPSAVRLLRASGALQVAHLSALSDTDKQFFHLLDHLTAEWAVTKDPVAFNAKLGRILQAVQGRMTDLSGAHLLQVSQEHMLLEVFENVKNAVLQVVNNLGTGAKAATGLSETIGNGQQLVKSAAAQFQVADLLTNNATSTGFFGGLKNKVKGWFGFRNLEVHYGLMDTLSSVRNLWSSISEAKDTSDRLKGTFTEAQGIADNVQSGINLFNSVVGANA